MATTIQQIETPKRARALDMSSKWYVVGEELITEGDFGGGGAAWTTTTGWADSAGYGAWTTGGADGHSSNRVHQTIPTLVAGRSYKLTFTISNNTSGRQLIRFDGGGTRQDVTKRETGSGVSADSLTLFWSDGGYGQYANGTHTLYFQATEAHTVFSFYGNTFYSSFRVDDISLKEIRYLPNNNHGQIYSGRALEFDGVTDYFQHNGGTNITGVNTFDDGSPWTFACWMYFNSSATTAQFFVGKDEDVKPHLMKPSDSSGVEIRFREDGSGDYYKFTTGGYPPYDTWHRVVVTTDGTTMTAYINGVLFGSFTKGDADHDGNGTVFSTTKMHFTGWGHPYETGGDRSYAFNGMMSDGQVWDAAWTADDASYDYLNPESLALNRGGTSLTNSNLKMWYPMQDGHRGQQSYVLDASNTGLGDELVTNGDFSTAGEPTITTYSLGWYAQATGQSGSSITGGELVLYNDTSNSHYNRVYATDGSASRNIMTIGKTYKLTYTVSKISGSPVLKYYTGGAYITGNSTVGTHSFYFTQDSSQLFILSNTYTTAPSTIKLSNVSVKPVNDKNNATTVFLGDEQITATANRDFSSASNWYAYPTSGNTPGTFGDDGSPQNLEIAGTSSTDAQGGALANDKFTTPVVGRTYRISAEIWWNDGSSPGIGSVFYFYYAGATSDAFEVTAVSSGTTYTKDVIATDAAGALLVYYKHANTEQWNVDNFSVKEIGTASGWTDADQQLHIPQTALQSYNELAWFDGYADYIQLPNPYSYDLITVSAWIYVGWETSAHKCWFASRDSSEDGLLLTVSSTEKLFAKFNGASFSTSNSIPTGEWIHVVYTFDGTTMKLYINGEQDSNSLVASTSGSFTGSDMDVTLRDATIGVDSQAGRAYPFPGSITGVTIHNVAINAGKVRELYNDGKELDATTFSGVSAIQGYWRNNGLNTWTDLSSNSNNGTVNNITETLLIPVGVDRSRDSQGFIMNRERNTSSLNLAKNNDTADYRGDGMEVYNTKDGTVDGQFDSTNNGLGDFTIEFWFKTNQNLSSGSSVLYQSAAYSAPNWSGLDIHLNSNGSIGVFLYRGASSGGASLAHSNNGTSADQDYADGNWHHVVFVADRSAKGTLIIDKIVESYIDINEYDHDSDAATAMLDITDVVCFKGSQRIGSSTSAFQASSRTNRSALDGQIDGFKIYNDLLTFDTADGSITEGEEITSGQVLKNYNATKHNHKN